MDLKNSWIAKQPITHRGLHDNAHPENSLGAFENSIVSGLPIELDVHILKDGKIVVFHDDNLKRMTGLDRKIRSCDYEEIKNLNLLDTNYKIPLIEEVLELVDGKVPLMIEIKNEGRIGNLEKGLHEFLKKYGGDFAIQSFNPFSVGWFKENAPRIVRGQLSGDFRGEDLAFYKKLLLRNFALNRVSSPHFVNYDIRVLPCWAAKRQKDNGLLLLGWTACSIEQYEQAKKICSNVIFEGFMPEHEFSIDKQKQKLNSIESAKN